MNYLIFSMLYKQIHTNNTIENAIIIKQLSLDQNKHIKAHIRNYDQLAVTKQSQSIYIRHFSELTTLLLFVIAEVHDQSIESLKKHLNEMSMWYEEYLQISYMRKNPDVYLIRTNEFFFLPKTFDYSVWNTQPLHKILDKCGKVLMKHLNNSTKTQKLVNMPKVMHKQLITFYKQEVYTTMIKCMNYLQNSLIERKKNVVATINLKIISALEEHPYIYSENSVYLSTMHKKLHLLFIETAKNLQAVQKDAYTSIDMQAIMMNDDFLQLYTEQALCNSIKKIIK